MLTIQTSTSEFHTDVIVDVSVSLCEPDALDGLEKRIRHSSMVLPIEFRLSGHFMGTARSKYGIPIWIDEPVGKCRSVAICRALAR